MDITQEIRVRNGFLAVHEAAHAIAAYHMYRELEFLNLGKPFARVSVDFAKYNGVALHTVLFKPGDICRGKRVRAKLVSQRLVLAARLQVNVFLAGPMSMVFDDPEGGRYVEIATVVRSDPGNSSDYESVQAILPDLQVVSHKLDMSALEYAAARFVMYNQVAILSLAELLISKIQDNGTASIEYLEALAIIEENYRSGFCF